MSEQHTAHFSLDKLPVRLEGTSNYVTWCTYVQAALLGQDLYGHVTCDTVKPAATTNADGSSTEPDTKRTADWTRRDYKAQSIIMLGVAPSMIHHLAGSGNMTAKQMWDTLATQCRRKDMATRVSLIQQLFTARLRGADSVDQHISMMQETRTQLVNIGMPLDLDQVAAISLLLSVPAEVPQWEMVLRSYTQSESDPTWDGVSAAIRAEAALQHQRDRSAAEHVHRCMVEWNEDVIVSMYVSNTTSPEVIN